MSNDAATSIQQSVRVKPITKKYKVEPKSLLSYRMMIFGRFVLSMFGGYYLSAILAMCLSVFFVNEPIKASAVMAVTMLAFVIHCGVFIWVFMVNSTVKAWLGVIIPSIVLTLIYWLIKG